MYIVRSVKLDVRRELYEGVVVATVMYEGITGGEAEKYCCQMSKLFKGNVQSHPAGQTKKLCDEAQSGCERVYEWEL